MGSPSSTMGTGTKLLLGLAFLGVALASPLPQPQPFVEPFGLIGRLLGLQGSGTLNSFKPEKPKPFKPEEECICERTFHKKPDKKKKKPKDPCDCYGAPESGYGVPSKPVSVIYTYEPLSNEPTTYSVPASPTPEPVYIEHKPVATYQQEAPVYEPKAPFYEVPAPSYESPAPTYNPPAPVYDAPAPAAVSYSPPAPAYAGPVKPFTAFRPIYRSFEESPPQPLRPKFTYNLL